MIVSGFTSIADTRRKQPNLHHGTGVGLPDAMTVSIVGTADSIASWFKSIGKQADSITISQG